MFDPFKIQLRISQSAGNGTVTSPDTSPAKTKTGVAARVPQPSQGQEIRLVVPEIGVVMDSREFEVLTDVISNVGLAQVCHVRCRIRSIMLMGVKWAWFTYLLMHGSQACPKAQLS